MSSIVCLKLLNKVSSEDLSTCDSSLNSDPDVATREGLEYTCEKKQFNGYETRTVFTDYAFTVNNYSTLRFVPVSGPFLDFSGGAVI